MSPYEAVEKILQDTEQLMEDLYQSGLDTVHDGTLASLESKAAEAGQYGMAYLSDLLARLFKGLSVRRHQIERQPDEAAAVYAKLNEYLSVCSRKTEYDKALEYYKKGEESAI